jgi:hypothetical protein
MRASVDLQGTYAATQCVAASFRAKAASVHFNLPNQSTILQPNKRTVNILRPSTARMDKSDTRSINKFFENGDVAGHNPNE